MKKNEMNSYINLFKALPVETRTNTFSDKYLNKGVLIEDSIIESYDEEKLKKVIKKLVPSDASMNKTFHKSWKKVRDASIEQLVIEQAMHYFTTYGFEALGCYDKDSVYIPNEKLKLEAEGGIEFVILRGITRDELKESVIKLGSSGIALNEDDLSDLITVIKANGLTIDISKIENKELAVRLCKELGIFPENPVEYLRLKVYEVTESSLLIKNRETIEAIKSNCNKNVFEDYEKEFGLTNLASIFYRFKPLFLAFKNEESATTINKIRKLATKYHKPIPEDCFAAVTKNLRNNTFNMSKFKKSLDNANLFRKIKLVQALFFYGNQNADGIVYAIRNGKSFATKIAPKNLNGGSEEVLDVTLKSIEKSLKHLKGKKIFMDANLAVPTSGKMFVGDIPFGSYFSTKKSLVLGVSWKDTTRRIDLDLSMSSVDAKVGWDARYRDNNFLFSGDIIAAPHGATEAFLVRKEVKDGTYLLNLNFFNAGYGKTSVVPFTMFVAEEKEYKRLEKNAMVSQDNMLFWAKSSIDSNRRQKTIGVLKVENGFKKFYAYEFKSGQRISASLDEKNRNKISYYNVYLDSIVEMCTLLENAGAEIVDSVEKADIDLSLASLTKVDLLKLLTP